MLGLVVGDLFLELISCFLYQGGELNWHKQTYR